MRPMGTARVSNSKKFVIWSSLRWLQSPCLHNMTDADPSLERTFRGHRSYVSSLSFSPTLKQLASASGDHCIMLWNFKPALRAFRFIGHKVRKHGVCLCVLHILVYWVLLWYEWNSSYIHFHSLTFDLLCIISSPYTDPEFIDHTIF